MLVKWNEAPVVTRGLAAVAVVTSLLFMVASLGSSKTVPVLALVPGQFTYLWTLATAAFVEGNLVAVRILVRSA
jgi:hypothetical protein